MVTRSTLPLLHDGSLPPIALMVQWLAHLKDPATIVIAIDQMPPGNGSIPDLLAGAGIRHLSLSRPPIARPFRWDGWAGGRIYVNASDLEQSMPVHHGDLPSDLPLDHVDHGVLGLIDLARLEDANAVRVMDTNAEAVTSGATVSGATTSGAAWHHILAAISDDGTFEAPSVPPLASHGANRSSQQCGAWNPLPVARQAIVSLPVPAGTAPWGLQDERGARHPVQVVEGPVGRELLSTLPLGALASTVFEPIFDAVPSCHWEVSRTVIDNGRVRAELDPLGQIIRLCTDGRFVDWAGPALQPLLDGLPLSGQTTTTVLEDGPVRARIAVNRHGAQGQLHIMYTLHAHEDILRIAVSWNGDMDIVIDLPTSKRSAPLEVAGDLASWLVKQRHDVRVPDRPLLPGIRWARLHDSDGSGLTLIGSRPLTISGLNGHLAVHVTRNASFALCENARPAAAMNLGTLSQTLATPHRASSAAPLPPAFRLDGDTVTAWWVRRPDAWQGELLLGQQHHQRARCVLYLANAQEVQRCDLRGNPTAPIARLPDIDGYEIDLTGGSFALIRWR